MRRAIGIFDSGLGGLTVVKELIKKLPKENIVYFGDTAHLPYGSKSSRIVTKFSFQNTEFLIKHNIKLLVVACNTASSVSLDKLKDRFNLPIVGVIAPGVMAASQITRNKHIGVIGTEATIASQSYVKALKKTSPDLRIFTKACPLFVPLVEEGWINKDVTYKIAEEYLKNLKSRNIDTLILGCTHYPLLKRIIAKVMGPGVKLIDSAKATADVVTEFLDKKGLVNRVTKRGEYEFFVSDLHPKFVEIGKRFLGKNSLLIKQVNLDE